jgi:hypothetical protein
VAVGRDDEGIEAFEVRVRTAVLPRAVVPVVMAK